MYVQQTVPPAFPQHNALTVALGLTLQHLDNVYLDTQLTRIVWLPIHRVFVLAAWQDITCHRPLIVVHVQAIVLRVLAVQIARCASQTSQSLPMDHVWQM